MENTALRTLESCGQISETTLKRALWEDLAATLLVTGEMVNVANRSYGNGGVGHTYTVTLATDGTPSSCTCPHNTYHGAPCKHLVFIARQPLLLASARAIQASRREPAPEPETLADRRAARALTDGGEDVDDAGDVSGPFIARDGLDVYAYFVCERCGMETCDSSIRESCWGCEADVKADAALEPERDAELVAEEDERKWAVLDELERRAERAFEGH